MKLCKGIINSVILILLMAGCASTSANLGPKREARSYLSKTIAVREPVNLYIRCDYSNVEIYSWDKKEVRFEVSKMIRGVEDKETLKKKLNDFTIDMGIDKEKVFINSKYKGSIKGAADKSVDLKVYLPKKISSVNCKLDLGTIKVYDDMKCSLKADVDMANTEIKRFEGKLEFKGSMGNLKICAGKLFKDSNILLEQGNIIIRSEVESKGWYRIETGLGNVDLMLPADSQVDIENLGPVGINEFKEAVYPAKMILGTKMGKISVKKY